MFAYDKKDSYTFSFTSPDELRKYCEDNGYEIPFSKDLSVLGKELKVSTRAGEKILKNRLVTHPMEGFDGETNGAPGELTRRRYRRFASSGTALIWSEAISIVPEGRTSDHQLFIADHNLDTFKSLMTEIREISDAPVIVVSEETGTISIAYEGELKRNFNYNSLKKELENIFEVGKSARVPGSARRFGRTRQAENDHGEKNHRDRA